MCVCTQIRLSRLKVKSLDRVAGKHKTVMTMTLRRTAARAENLQQHFCEHLREQSLCRSSFDEPGRSGSNLFESKIVQCM